MDFQKTLNIPLEINETYDTCKNLNYAFLNLI